MRGLMWVQALLFFVLLPVSLTILVVAMVARQLVENWRDGWAVLDRDYP